MSLAYAACAKRCRRQSCRCIRKAIDVPQHAACLPRWHPLRRSHSKACQRVHALALEASAGLNALSWTPQMRSRPQRNIRSQLLPRNIRRMQSATAVMPMMDDSGMNTTELKRATQLL
ncbi:MULTISPECIES: hypothetical protein [Xanthomonas]|uniref:hypothetical protein n=1 Tax=Xanthomonas TaxID=338 RepID=UPI000F8C5AE5|nr:MULTISPECIES: hypothetical protein [Xanthomonas]MBB4768889.1 hypothetical protein [Xanthomonas arboricola]